jgi:hypothetical protein
MSLYIIYMIYMDTMGRAADIGEDENRQGLLV